MKTPHSAFYRRFSLRLTGVLLAFFLLLGSLLVMYRYESQYDSTRERLVDTLGLQRAYTLGMSKDAARKSSLLAAMTSPDRVESLETLQGKVRDINRNLALYRGSFDATFRSVRLGYFVSDGEQYRIPRFREVSLTPLLDELSPVWNDMREAAIEVENATVLDVSFRQSLIRVVESGDKVLEISMALNRQLLDSLELRHQRNLNTFYLLLSLLVVLVILLLYGVLHYLVKPLDRLYLHVAEMGVGRRLLSGSRDMLAGDPRMASFNRLPTGKGKWAESASRVESRALLSGDGFRLQPVLDDMGKLLDEFRDLLVLIENVNHSKSFEEILVFVKDTFAPYLPFDHIGIALFSHENPELLEAQYGIDREGTGGLARKLLGITASVKDTGLYDMLRNPEQEIRVIHDLEAHVGTGPVSEYNRILLDAGIRSSLTLALHNRERIFGFLFFSSRLSRIYQDRHVEFLETVSDTLSIAVEKNLFLDELLFSSVLALAKLAEAKDEDTAVHLDRIRQYTALLCRCLVEDGRFADTLPDAYMRDIIRFSPMHDIGKVGVRDAILLKPGKLTVEEFEQMKTHATFGANVLREAEDNILKAGRSLFGVGIEIAQGHHEKWNGSGYPSGLSGNEIPFSARIVALVDVLDALTSRRPYKEPYPFEQAVDILREGQGSHFDPDVAECFFKNLHRFRDLYTLFVETQPEVFS